MKLRQTQAKDIERLRGWFKDKVSLRNWGGPNFRFPSNSIWFAEDCKWPELTSWSADDRDGQLLAFGQAYPKLGRTHLAHIALAPQARGKKLGISFVQSLVKVASARLGLAECGLDVWRDNLSAVNCYRRVGFKQQPHEENLARAGVSSRDIARMIYMVRTPKG